ncbi:MAG: O-antigen ligase family protein, partial [Candidatus Harrisonbacteria bacterium]|nr:O-antigen ligase family protein [Candidatus Harrisonbacteria bacterium]
KKSFAPRIWTWKSALAGVLERPWLGWGPENFAFAFDKYYNPNHFGLESFFDRTHNIFLEYLISGGILLLLAWLSLFFLAIRSIFKRKKKDIWFGILLGLIAAYMVQGFFLFDVLVIYLQLFLLFAYLISAQYFDRDEVVMSPSRSRLLLLALIGILFVVNLLWISSFVFFVLLFIALGLTIFSALEREGGRYHLDPLRVLAFLLLLLITIFLLYATLYRPLKKNQLLTEAIIERGLAEKIEKYERALGYPSPLGQEEVINSIQQFSLEFESQIVANQAQVSREALRAVINHANLSFDSFSQPYIGLRNHYLNGAINLRAGASFSQADYLERGKAMFTEALEQAPTRIEFIDLLLQISIFEKDKERYDELLVLAELLRPDLDWPQYPEE